LSNKHWAVSSVKDLLHKIDKMKSTVVDDCGLSEVQNRTEYQASGLANIQSGR